MSDDWWTRKLGGGNSRPSTAYAQPPASPSTWTPQPTQGAAPPAPQVTIENLGAALQHWRGGEGARNSARCPECGSDKLFRRRVGATEAAPLCYHCGYNGLFRQGDPANWSA